MNDFNLQGLTGDVFNLGGKVAGSIPPSGRPDSISFVVSRVMAEQGQSPAWADMTVDGNIPVRINPDICKPPYVRLFDFVATIGQRTDEISALEPDNYFRVTFGGQEFLFWVASIQSRFGRVNVIMVDTLERVLKWNPQNLQVHDGQHRHGGKKRRK